MKKKNKNKIICYRCGDKTQMIYSLPMGLKGTIDLCEICWVGLSVGLKRDIETYMMSREDFNNKVGYTKLINKLLKKYNNEKQ